MIRVGITGGDTRDGAELIRILVNHPDVDIVAVTSPSHKGRGVHELHHGLIGEIPLSFSDNIPLNSLSVLFLADDSYLPDTLPDDLKIIDMADALKDNEDFVGEKIVYGLSEINRKPMVRGARIARVPNAIASLALVMLGPIAFHLLLDGDLDIEAEIPSDMQNQEFINEAISQIKSELPHIQKSFDGNVNLSLAESPSERGMRLRIKLPLSLTPKDVEALYEGIYDDHNFSFLTPMPVTLHEVEGTNKCLINVSQPEPGVILLDAVADPRMRGGAGEAVHVMNLLCGLHEKTGLALKTLKF